MNETAAYSVLRRGCALGLYKGALNTALMVALFHAFPDHIVVSALAVLVFSQGLAGVVFTIEATALKQNVLDDAAERKTRHTVVLAADPNWLRDSDFWGEVDRRVAKESRSQEASPWWAQTGLTLGNFASLVARDIVSVVFALAITGITQ
ncbi:MAG: hypothetical protein AB7O49_19350 [Sphingomonadales bacterium]